MTPRRPKTRAVPRRVRPGFTYYRRRRSAWPLGLITLVALALVAWGLRGHFVGAGARRTPAAAGGSDPAAGLSRPQAYARAVALHRGGHVLESLPYYLHLVEALPDVWQTHFDYGAALWDAALETRRHRDLAPPATRASDERLALVRQALDELDQAERLAPRPHDRAVVMLERAHRLMNWGFGWDALLELRRAQAADPAWGLVAERADFVATLLHRPRLSLEVEP